MKKSWQAVLAVASIGLASAPTWAQDTAGDQTTSDISRQSTSEKPPLIPTSAFADRNQIGGAQLSPDGRKMAMRALLKGDTYIYIFDPVTRQASSRVNVAGGETELEWFRWAGNDKILVSLSVAREYFGEEVRFTRLFAIDLARGDQYFIGLKSPVPQGDDIVHVDKHGRFILLAMQKTPYDYPSVHRIPLEPDADDVLIQRERRDVWNWYADDDGVVRMGTGWSDRRLRVWYRETEADNFRLIDKIKEGSDQSRYWDVARIVSGSDDGYALAADDDERIVLRKVDYASGEFGETVYRNDDWDVLGFDFDDDGEPLSVYYADDRDRIHWFDEDNRRWQQLLEKALPEDEIWITSRAEDGSRMLVWAGGAADPGGLYIFTPGEMKVDPFMDFRPSIRPQQLAAPKPVDYTARDGTSIRAYLTLPRGREAKDLPLIILPHGRPFGVRDKLDYDDEVQLLANRGYAVLQPNYRGSGGFGSAFSEKGAGQIGRAMQDDLDDAMDWAVKEGIADKDRVCVVGGSYGGYAAMWAVLRNPERYRCAASWAGVTDWRSLLRYDRNYLSRTTNKKWRAAVLGESETKTLDEVSAEDHGHTLTRPLLLAHGEKDSRVPFSQFKKMRKAAEGTGQLTVLTFEDEGHSFSKAENEKAWYDALEAFLKQHNPAD